MMLVYYCPSKGSPLPVSHKLSPRCSELNTSIAASAAAKLRLAGALSYLGATITAAPSRLFPSLPPSLNRQYGPSDLPHCTSSSALSLPPSLEWPLMCTQCTGRPVASTSLSRLRAHSTSAMLAFGCHLPVTTSTERGLGLPSTWPAAMPAYLY